MTDFERCAGSSPFCLGMVDFDCCGVKHKFDNQENTDDDFQPPMKKGKLSLAKGKKKVLSPSKRFNTTITTNEIEQQLSHSDNFYTAHFISLKYGFSRI